MFAVIKTGGKQYKVAEDTILEVEKLEGEAGDTVQFDDVLMLGGDKPVLGAPLVDGAAVAAEILEQKRGPKTIKFVKRRRKHSSQRRRGHRQSLTVVKISSIIASGATKGATPAKAAKPAAKKADDKAAKPAAKKAEAKKPAAKKADDKGAAKAAAGAASADAGVNAGTKPANLLDAPKGEADDLTRISGVGPKLLGVLNENGVYHFWQIAEWKGDEIAYMDDQLSFKGRIERDNWIEQATEFAAEAK